MTGPSAALAVLGVVRVLVGYARRGLRLSMARTGPDTSGPPGRADRPRGHDPGLPGRAAAQRRPAHLGCITVSTPGSGHGDGTRNRRWNGVRRPGGRPPSACPV